MKSDGKAGTGSNSGLSIHHADTDNKEVRISVEGSLRGFKDISDDSIMTVVQLRLRFKLKRVKAYEVTCIRFFQFQHRSGSTLKLQRHDMPQSICAHFHILNQIKDIP